MSLVGTQLQSFSVEAFQGFEFKKITDADLKGKWSVVFFYPADFTFVCPTELEDLENNYEKFKAAGCEIYSVSCDTHFVHKAWHDHSEKISRLTYPMLADPTQALAKDFEGGRHRRKRDVHRQSRGADRRLRSQFRQRRPQRRRTVAQAAGLPVRRRARRSGLPGQVAARRGDAEAEP